MICCNTGDQCYEKILRIDIHSIQHYETFHNFSQLEAAETIQIYMHLHSPKFFCHSLSPEQQAKRASIAVAIYLFILQKLAYSRITQSQNNRMVWVGRDLNKHPIHNPPATGRIATHQITVPSNMALDTSRDGAFTVSLGNFFQYLTFTLKNFY